MKPEYASIAMQFLVWLASSAFSVGVAWMVLRQVRRDVNGLGRKFGRVTALLVRQADTAEKREHVAKVIEGGT